MKSINLKTVIIVSECNHIGQMCLCQAICEVKRMTKQTGKKWIYIKSDYLFVSDQIDNFPCNPCSQVDDDYWVVQADSIQQEIWSEDMF